RPALSAGVSEVPACVVRLGAGCPVAAASFDASRRCGAGGGTAGGRASETSDIGITTMATIPVEDIKITRQFGPHQSNMAGINLATDVEPDKLVKTHCCFCGQQCGI